MSDTDRQFAEIWAMDEPAERDPVFALGVMQAIEQRRFRLEAAGLAVIVVAGCAAVWALGPVLAPGVEAFMPAADNAAVGPIAAGIVMAVFIWTWVTGRLGPMPA